ncbi:MAG TPA: pyridoxamine 5'-phosphate oxidase family protein [Kofleriaceae bacterium]|nr:pyridoxamine 5'-phosphate oxidase family protein [Kofleriaceae bacterium]
MNRTIPPATAAPARPSSDVAFTPSVKALQQRHGSRAAYARLEARGGWPAELDDDVIAFVGDQTGAFLATASADGQPYIQHRGGPRGFLRVLDRRTIAFADFRGNRQYITAGNLAENPRVHLFLIDHARRRRVKLWGTATIVEGDPALLARLTDPDYDGVPERAIVLHVDAWDVNCPQHIPQRLDAGDVARALATRDRRIAELEARVAELEATATAAATAAPRPSPPG